MRPADELEQLELGISDLEQRIFETSSRLAREVRSVRFTSGAPIHGGHPRSDAPAARGITQKTNTPLDTYQVDVAHFPATPKATWTATPLKGPHVSSSCSGHPQVSRLGPDRAEY